ncbi:hypothetical protein TSUD_137160 [Trifolium subterraneum]|uniref:Reverse transcriptase zinc-binding domain-containing protein n=1 Tax=Trifolium subterraneum TaxID=3900 RepID=A0A2Z6PDN0_TRISU|nr:hypothetical protein TSUD_137160 [Trifolium subterraneum]
MHDPWLRGSANRWVPSPQLAGVYQLSVRDLLHENYKAWNIAKVRNLFSKDAAEKILETPLVSSVREDKVVWEEERNRCYSVKSWYKLAMRYIIGSDKYHVVGNWNGIWKAQASHKARHLLWRLCRGCLPTRSRLLERRVECTLNCPVCDEEIEDELHIFFRCRVKLEYMLLMLGMVGTQYISYRVIMTSVGLCFRNNSGHFMAGVTKWQQTVISSVEGEA